MTTNIRPKTLLPWLAALAVLLVVWFVPLPGQVLGKDLLAAGQMPQRRIAIEQARQTFWDAQVAYLDYVKQNNMSQLYTDIKSGIARVREKGGNAASVGALYGVFPYIEQLQRYASAGEAYFRQLEQYDNGMMAWTRSLGAVSSTMRKDSFPLASHLRIYPVPFGEVPDPPYMSPAQADAQIAAFKSDVERFSKVASLEESRQVVEQVDKDVDGVWAVGRSIQRFETLHEPYYEYLKVYDKTLQNKVAEIARGGTEDQSPIALALDVAIGVLTLLGIGALFMSGWQRATGGGREKWKVE